jgi:hypothetical protein
MVSKYNIQRVICYCGCRFRARNHILEKELFTLQNIKISTPLY